MGFNQQTLINLMSYPNDISSSEVAELREAIANYPYFQLGHSLLAKAMHDKQAPEAYATLSKAAIYAPNRRLLRQLFYEDLHIDRTNTPPVSGQETDELIQQETEYAQPEEPTTGDTSNETEHYEPPVDEETQHHEEDKTTKSDEVYDELEENLRKLRENKSKFSEEDDDKKKIADQADELFTSDQEETAQTEDKDSSTMLQELLKHDIPTDSDSNNQQMQNDLIDKFINTQDSVNLKIKPSVSAEEEIEDLSSQSTEVADNLISENLAKIYERQGKKEKAVEIYQKLIWKFPQKKAYFADRIESLKTD